VVGEAALPHSSDSSDDKAEGHVAKLPVTASRQRMLKKNVQSRWGHKTSAQIDVYTPADDETLSCRGTREQIKNAPLESRCDGIALARRWRCSGAAMALQMHAAKRFVG
jgi:hypothetical protein